MAKFVGRTPRLKGDDVIIVEGGWFRLEFLARGSISVFV